MKQIQLFKPVFYKEEILQEISKCLDASWTGSGYKTIEFEEKFKEYIGVKNAHFLNSATSGLHLALEILKLKNPMGPKEVITSPLTFISDSHVIKHARLKPIFVDTDEYLCMNPNSLEQVLVKHKPLAVIFTGIGGNTGRLLHVKSACKSHEVPLILDASHMMGTYIYGKHVGNEADFTVFSFQSVKNLPTADSGMLVCEDYYEDKLARKLSWLGIDKNTYTRQTTGGNWDYHVYQVGYKYHGNSIMAAMAIVGLRHLAHDNAARTEIAGRYSTKLKNNYRNIPMGEGCFSSRHLYQVRVDALERDWIINEARAKGIQLGVHYKNHKEYLIYQNSDYPCPESRQASRELISLPMGTHLSDEDVKYIIEVMNEIKL